MTCRQTASGILLHVLSDIRHSTNLPSEGKHDCFLFTAFTFQTILRNTSEPEGGCFYQQFSLCFLAPCKTKYEPHLEKVFGVDHDFSFNLSYTQEATSCSIYKSSIRECLSHFPQPLRLFFFFPDFSCTIVQLSNFLSQECQTDYRSSSTRHGRKGSLDERRIESETNANVICPYRTLCLCDRKAARVKKFKTILISIPSTIPLQTKALPEDIL